VPKRENIELCAQILAVLTGVSFIASAILQEILFAFWGLDFTAVASVEDVVLGGVRILSITLIAMLGAVPGAWVYEISVDDELGCPNLLSQFTRWSLVSFVMIAPLALWTYYHGGMAGLPAQFRISFFLSWMWYTSLWIIPILFLTSNVNFYQAVKFAKKKRLPNTTLTGAGAIALLLSVMEYESPYATIGSIIPSRDMPNPCEGKSTTVLWMGTRAAVLNCLNTRVVLVTAEAPYAVTVDRRPRWRTARDGVR